MSSGFGAEKIKDGKAAVIIDDNEVSKLLKEYKKIKKYMKSSLYKVKMIDGTEKKVTQLVEQYGKDDDLKDL
jgi:hypothetical protein